MTQCGMQDTLRVNSISYPVDNNVRNGESYRLEVTKELELQASVFSCSLDSSVWYVFDDPKVEA